MISRHTVAPARALVGAGQMSLLAARESCGGLVLGFTPSLSHKRALMLLRGYRGTCLRPLWQRGGGDIPAHLWAQHRAAGINHGWGCFGKAPGKTRKLKL